MVNFMFLYCSLGVVMAFFSIIYDNSPFFLKSLLFYRRYFAKKAQGLKRASICPKNSR